MNRVAACLLGLLTAVGVALATVGVAFAQDLTEGEIRKVDKEAQMLTIRHGPIANLEMPAMTMLFRVKDPALLDKVKPGDRIKFAVEKVQGAFTVVKIEPAP